MFFSLPRDLEGQRYLRILAGDFMGKRPSIEVITLANLITVSIMVVKPKGIVVV